MCVKLLETAKAALMVQLDYRTVTATTLRFYCVFLCTQSHGRLLYFKHAQRKRRQMKWVLGAPDGTNEDAPAVWCRCRSLYCADLGDVHLIFHRRSRIALKTQPRCDKVHAFKCNFLTCKELTFRVVHPIFFFQNGSYMYRPYLYRCVLPSLEELEQFPICQKNGKEAGH